MMPTSINMAKRNRGRAILARLDREFDGLRVELTNGGHYRLRLPGAQVVHMASTPSDWREFLNTRARLRRVARKS